MKAMIVILGSLSLLTLGACGDDPASSGSLANCGAFCAKLVECNPGSSTQECLSECNGFAQQFQRVSADCLAAYTSVNTCVGGLTCEQGEAWVDEIPPDSYPCKAQDDALEAVCN